MSKKKKSKYSLPFPKNIETGIVVSVLIVIIIIDVFFVKIIFPKFQDVVVSRTSPMHGNATYSMQGFIIVAFDIFAFCILYALLRKIAIKNIYKR
ncbi:MAG: hypothetical protein KAJ14_00415 [Candidatus Omnitrophica bacterium]|nr:hypothetical protein [Candidatus Omnitrophota bacterium]MCK5491557.1 hypothetical protein [Candidatus Omnitrophota bacterium]